MDHLLRLPDRLGTKAAASSLNFCNASMMIAYPERAVLQTLLQYQDVSPTGTAVLCMVHITCIKLRNREKGVQRKLLCIYS